VITINTVTFKYDKTGDKHVVPPVMHLEATKKT